jgi:hypothetical protein
LKTEFCTYRLSQAISYTKTATSRHYKEQSITNDWGYLVK